MAIAKPLHEIFNEARLVATRAGRFLDEACGGDSAMIEEVEKLLRADAEAGGFLEEPNPATLAPGTMTSATSSACSRRGADGRMIPARRSASPPPRRRARSRAESGQPAETAVASTGDPAFIASATSWPTVRTGQWTWWTTCSATLPRMKRARPE